jgi:hypothetical protein
LSVAAGVRKTSACLELFNLFPIHRTNTVVSNTVPKRVRRGQRIKVKVIRKVTAMRGLKVSRRAHARALASQPLPVSKVLAAIVSK